MRSTHSSQTWTSGPITMYATESGRFPQNEHRFDPAELGLSRPIVRWYLPTEPPRCTLDPRHVPRLVDASAAVEAWDAPAVVRRCRPSDSRSFSTHLMSTHGHPGAHQATGTSSAMSVCTL